MRTLLALALVATPMMAGPSSSATAPVKVRIVAPCHIQSSGELNFGTVLMEDYVVGGAISVTAKTAAGGTSQATNPTYVGCSNFKNSDMSVAEFHYRHDINFPVNITIQGHVIDPTNVSGVVTHGTVDLGTQGVKLAVTTDAPADPCMLFTPISGVEDKHFGIGGLLSIPAGVYGVQTGTVKVSIAYN